MKIGELAKRSGCRVVTIRYYEREGLLPEPARTAGNYRLYGETHAERLAFIRHCRVLDMTLDEIRALLDCHDHPEQPCHEADALIDAHLTHVADRIAKLQALEQSLVALRARCQGQRPASECGILKELSRPPGDEVGLVSGEESGHVPGVHPPREHPLREHPRG
ncbi:MULTISPECIES: Cd(II)/Pb(II)-responsive transcriptional regulator [Halomonadaceae]|uniref:Cd(II)/Pb(II)-responsive transcriptional regulator n=1 Tax=Halomonadaceae TaxID=28256 RepID=UPI0015818913|nr:MULTISPECIES: Cd(II)/Pb(II)-responsive transcriptional regulator [Halomonas]MDI4638178.1 Cd(II)/Pb(II)-responsive transcriptional regulator [Halomonas sp. BMC7]NUJ59178.1 Cd(II)/Pb(II)-responsive transcriptional regulator [Halomonas taeanensis]|tara:strand:- start:2128 stop:2619 length:492 start_codon:yes stop_codon:yes gene_type:complete